MKSTMSAVSLAQPDSITMSVDITDDLKFGADGHPTRASLKQEFDKVAKELAKRGGIKL